MAALTDGPRSTGAVGRRRGGQLAIFFRPPQTCRQQASSLSALTHRLSEAQRTSMGAATQAQQCLFSAAAALPFSCCETCFRERVCQAVRFRFRDDSDDRRRPRTIGATGFSNGSRSEKWP
eukprot:2277-Prymnesium_polylepis.1